MWEKLKDAMPFQFQDFISQMKPKAASCLPLLELTPKLFDFWKESSENNRQNLIGDINEYLPIHISSVEDWNSTIEGKKSQKILGQGVLEIYFSQLYSNDGQFLDLRLQNFRVLETQELEWKPSKYIYHFPKKFRSSLLELYRGFYCEDEQKLEQALLDLNLMNSDDSPETKIELKNLMIQHFGEGKTAPISFEIEKFKTSFFQLFDFFAQHEKKIPADFFFLGLYLFSLYLNLNEISGKFPVREIFLARDQALSERNTISS